MIVNICDILNFVGFTSAGLGVTIENQQGYILWLQKNGLVPDTNQEHITKN